MDGPSRTVHPVIMQSHQAQASERLGAFLGKFKSYYDTFLQTKFRRTLPSKNNNNNSNNNPVQIYTDAHQRQQQAT